MHELKSASKIKLSHVDDRESMLLERDYKSDSTLQRSYEQINSHFFCRKFNST